MARDPLTKIKTLDALVVERERLRQQGRKVASTNGCFDLLHWGHIRYLHQARELADCLMVLVNSDDSVQRLKGPNRPIQNAQARARQIAGLESVDFVCIFSESTPEAVLKVLHPDIHCKGGDYRPEALPETKVVQAAGGKMVCLSLEAGFSTSAIIDKILHSEE